MTGPDLGQGLTEALQNVLSGLVSQLTSVSDAFRMMTGPIEKFVEALSPGTMQVFGQAIRDLNATIGLGVIPVIRVFGDTMHKAAGTLLPLMNKLAPVVERISEIIAGLMLSSVRLLVAKMEDWLPTIDSLTVVFQALADGIRVAQAVVTSAFESVAGIFTSLFGGGGEGGIKGMMEKFKTAIHALVQVLLRATAILANSFGATGFLSNLSKNLRAAAEKSGAKAGIGGALANAGIKSLDQFQKDLALAAAQAVAGGAGGPAQSEDTKLLTQLAADVDEIVAGKKTIQAMLREMLKELARDIGRSVRDALPDPKAVFDEAGAAARGAGENALQRIGNTANRVGNVIADWIQRRP